MTRGAVCCDAQADVGKALDIMRLPQVRRPPVIGGQGHVVGVISLTDIVRCAALSDAEVVDAVARIRGPVGTVGGYIVGCDERG